MIHLYAQSKSIAKGLLTPLLCLAFILTFSSATIAQCLFTFERVDDNTIIVRGTGGSVDVARGGSNAFFFYSDQLFSTAPTNLTPTVVDGGLTLNGISGPTGSGNTCCGGLPGFIFPGVIAVPATLTSNMGTATLTWADGVLEDEISGALINYHTFQPVCGVPTIGSVSLSDQSACFDDNGVPTFTADVTLSFESSHRLNGDASPGNLVLSGDASFTASASSFGSVGFIRLEDIPFPADGGPISLTAGFDAATGSFFTNENIETAPTPCVVTPSCRITFENIAFENTCDGDNATFSLFFEAIAGSGNYDVVANVDNTDLGVTAGQVLGSIRGGATGGPGIEIMGTVPSTTVETTLNVSIVDVDTDECGTTSPISVSIAACVSTESLPAMNRWSLLLLSMLILSAGLFAYRRF